MASARGWSQVLGAGVFVFAGACSSHAALDDAGTGDTGVTTTPDAGTTADAGSTNYLHACANTTACGTGLTCLVGFAGGLCTKVCARDAQCGTGSVCNTILGASGYCVPACTPGGGECDAVGGSCYDFSSTDTPSLGCHPTCFASGAANRPANFATCPTGQTCVVEQGVCASTASPPAMGTGEVGDPCASSDECKSELCIPQTYSDGTESGTPGGECFANARLTASATDLQSNCPAGSTPVAFSSDAMAGDLGYCLKSCTADTDCRTGYRCNKAMGASSGFCDTIDCTAAGMTCPSGTTCQHYTGSDGTTTYGECLAGTSDGGVATNDASTGANDASTVDGGG